MSIQEPAPRYAIYFVPRRDSELYRFGASALGYDCYSGRDTPFIGGADLLKEFWVDSVREPRIYGFHATFKAPFYLAKGLNEADLALVLPVFAADHAAVLVGELAVRELGSFIALVPKTPRPLLDQLAQACVKEFDRFRAPMREPERARRMAAGLSADQIENLENWGYPYVFKDFRFHMTLTGSLGLPERSQALRFLCNEFKQMRAANSLTIDQIVVARQIDKAERFQVLSTASLGQSSYRPYAYSF